MLRVYCRPQINNAPSFKDPNIRIPVIIPMKGKGLLIRVYITGNEGAGYVRDCIGTAVEP